MLLHIYLLSFVLQFTTSTVNRDLKVSSGLDEVSRDSVAMRFYIQINNTGKDCHVQCIPGRCCLEQGEEENCDVLQMIGKCSLDVPAGESRTVRLAAPLLNPFDRRGYCVVHLHSKREGHSMFRDTVTIPFDSGKDPDITPCPNIDQDPLNNCRPVDCDTYYNGQKPYYSKRLKRCLKTPPCRADLMLNLSTNKCVHQITDEDIKYLKSLPSRKRKRKDIVIVGTTPKADKVNKSLQKAEKALSGSIQKAMEIEPSTTYLPLRFICWNSTQALTCIIIAQCFVVFGLAFFVSKRCKCNHKKEKEVINRFFSYRQTDSMTTPLISSSNCGTATTCQFQSDSSSNVDKKIKCYKACHKEQAKSSMSDDILSRCLKRRDWIRKPKSSDVIPEFKEFKEKEDYGVQVAETEHKIFKKWTGNKCACKVQKPVGEQDFVPAESLPIAISSEQEVKCYEYESKPKVVEKVSVSKSTGKGAQASFSKDSIDDFLSERGMIYLAGDNASKYSFSSESSSDFNMISGSSKTSKNAISVVASLLNRKPGPSSDPGGGDALELLHMSRASMFSSSNPSDYAEFRRVKDSRSSL